MMNCCGGKWLRGIGVAGILLVSAGMLAEGAPETPPVSKFAPVEDLAAQAKEYIADIDKSLAEEADYDVVKQSRVKKQANTLAAIALNIGMHDQDHPLKQSAPAIIKAARDLAANAENYAAAAKARDELKQAMAGQGTAEGVELKWEPVASLGQLMKQVPVVNNRLKRSVRPNRFKRMADEAAGDAAVLAAIGQAALFDTHEVKDPADTGKWYQYAADLRDAAGEVNAAIRAEDLAKTTAAMKRLAQSCDTCHEAFRITAINTGAE